MKKPRILIIDDEPDAGRILSKILEEDGFSVQVAASGEEGLKRLKQGAYDYTSKPFDLELIRELIQETVGSR